MKHLSLSVSTADVANSLDGDGETFADLLNEIARDGAVSERFTRDFADALDSEGRSLLQQLIAAADAAEGA